MKTIITQEHEAFRAAERVHPALTATLEKRALIWIAKRLPGWVHPDHLTGLGLAAQAAAGVCYVSAELVRR